MKTKFIKILSLMALLSVLAACGGTSEKPPFEYMANMTNSPAVKAYEEVPRKPVEGTIPRNFHPYPYTKEEGDKAGAEGVNPLPLTKEVFAKGQLQFNSYCIVCHGPKGEGDGYIIPKFPKPPSLLSDKVRNWPDARIYHVISMGQNLMPSYATQIRQEDRWAVIHYVRALQRAANPTGEDIALVKKMSKEGTLP
ncbi:MAG: c-type cytochrome [Deltaproteobacteria bacterium]|nr:c-type cytochrome [Deltaproteobacteria bacterium]